MGAARVSAIRSGHINETFLVESGAERYVLQRLSPIFGPELHIDIDAVTAHLQSAGLVTPRLVPDLGGRLFVQANDGVWRLLTHIEGETVLAADSPDRCERAGELLGRFHRALWDCEHEFRHRRLGVHDTRRHLEKLRALLQGTTTHRCFSAVEPVGRAILETAEGLVLPEGVTLRVVHGDPKISNVIFGPGGEARALVDLDTLARMPIAVELGDALRSWCSPQGEEVEGPIDLDFCAAALRGYSAAIGDLPTPAERVAIPRTVEVIAVELAARFCADALEERYFGWDAARFASAADHNLVRARAQLALARSIRSSLPRLAALVDELWG